MKFENFQDVKNAYCEKGYALNCHDLALGFIQEFFGDEEEFWEYIESNDEIEVEYDDDFDRLFKPKFI